MLTIKLPDGNNLKFPKEVTGLEIAEKISKSLYKEALIMSVNGELKDLYFLIKEDSLVKIITAKDPTKYQKAIKGTNLDAICAILLIPPMITIHSKTANTAPVKNLGILNVSFITTAMLLICGIFPVPKHIINKQTENRMANHLIFKPFSI